MRASSSRSRHGGVFAWRWNRADRAGLLGESAGYHGEDDGKVVRSGAGGAEGPHVLGPKVAGELVDPPRLAGMGRAGIFMTAVSIDYFKALCRAMPPSPVRLVARLRL